MKSLWLAAAVVSALLAVEGCRERKSEPVPGPQSTSAWNTTPARAAHGALRPDVSEISWFQGTLEEAFSHRGCHESRTLLHY
jgi:hypothetical protein